MPDGQPEGVHVSSIVQIEESISRDMCVYTFTCVHAIATNGEGGMGPRKTGRGLCEDMEDGGGGGDDAVTLGSQK